jgi:alkaline phosphatase D
VSQPDAWIWLGDMYYADEAPFECSAHNLNSSACQCEPSFLRQPPFSCPAGDLDNARDKMVAQVSQPGYQAFLRYACPGFDDDASPAGGGGGGAALVPAGDDLAVCPRPILGVYDDHDYGANNLNHRLPSKHLLKQVGRAGLQVPLLLLARLPLLPRCLLNPSQILSAPALCCHAAAQIYLDALGVSATSPRRAAQQGIQWQYRLNPGTRQEVQLVLLDGRYERAPLPCEIRGDW